jgi:hypothetical protein
MVEAVGTLVAPEGKQAGVAVGHHERSDTVSAAVVAVHLPVVIAPERVVGCLTISQ